MERRMQYSLWKQFYSEFPAGEYNPKKKSVLVQLPDTHPAKVPAEWSRTNGNRYFTPGGCEVLFWGSGLARNYLVQRSVSAFRRLTKTITPGLDSMQRVIDTVRQFESEQEGA